VDEVGHAKLADFGLSVLLIEDDMTATTSSGTYRWSAPELFVEGDVLRKPPSDIYSFGCACLEVIVRCCTASLNLLIWKLRLTQGSRRLLPSLVITSWCAEL
jgi:serine/threonine protein kinase